MNVEIEEAEQLWWEIEEQDRRELER